jgi:hypothetical protein
VGRGLFGWFILFERRTHDRFSEHFASFELQYGIIFMKMPLPIIAPAFRQPRNRCEANRTSKAKGWGDCAFIL